MLLISATLFATSVRAMKLPFHGSRSRSARKIRRRLGDSSEEGSCLPTIEVDLEHKPRRTYSWVKCNFDELDVEIKQQIEKGLTTIKPTDFQSYMLKEGYNKYLELESCEYRLRSPCPFAEDVDNKEKSAETILREQKGCPNCHCKEVFDNNVWNNIDKFEIECRGTVGDTEAANLDFKTEGVKSQHRYKVICNTGYGKSSGKGSFAIVPVVYAYGQCVCKVIHMTKVDWVSPGTVSHKYVFDEDSFSIMTKIQIMEQGFVDHTNLTKYIFENKEDYIQFSQVTEDIKANKPQEKPKKPPVPLRRVSTNPWDVSDSDWGELDEYMKTKRN